MKKQFALTALALAIAAPGVATATEVSLSGVVQTQLFLDSTAEITDEDPSIAGGDVRFLITAEEEVNGITGYAHYRLDGEDSKTKNVSGSNVTSDNVRVGLKGDFGNVMLGEDTEIDMGEYANDINSVQISSAAAIGYTGAFGPVNVEATYSPSGSDDLFAIGAEFAAGPVTLGATVGSDTDGTTDTDTYIVGAKTTLGGVTLAAHTWEDDTDGAVDDGYAVKVSGSVAAWSWGVTYDAAEDSADVETTTTRLDLGTTIAGGLGFGIRYNNVEKDGAEDDDFLRLQLTKSF